MGLRKNLLILRVIQFPLFIDQLSAQSVRSLLGCKRDNGFQPELGFPGILRLVVGILYERREKEKRKNRKEGEVNEKIEKRKMGYSSNCNTSD